MRSILFAAAALTMLAGAPAIAQSAAAKAKFNTTDTELGTLLDNGETKALVEKHIPGLTTNEQIAMARAMTLRSIQQFAPDEITDARLNAIDADLAKIN